MEYLASNIAVPLDAMLPEGADLLRGKVARAVGLRPREVRDVVVVRRSVDARKKGNVHFVVSVAFACEGAEPRPARGVAVKLYAPYEPPRIPDLSGVLDGAARPVVVGAGRRWSSASRACSGSPTAARSTPIATSSSARVALVRSRTAS